MEQLIDNFYCYNRMKRKMVRGGVFFLGGGENGIFLFNILSTSIAIFSLHVFEYFGIFIEQPMMSQANLSPIYKFKNLHSLNKQEGFFDRDNTGNLHLTSIFWHAFITLFTRIIGQRQQIACLKKKNPQHNKGPSKEDMLVQKLAQFQKMVRDSSYD